MQGVWARFVILIPRFIKREAGHCILGVGVEPIDAGLRDADAGLECAVDHRAVLLRCVGHVERATVLDNRRLRGVIGVIKTRVNRQCPLGQRRPGEAL